MPLLTRVLVKTAIAYFALALLFGIFMAVRPTAEIFPVQIHLFVFGWLTQLIFGVIYWMFPKYSKLKPRGYEFLGWITYITLNLGLITRAIFEPLHAAQASNVSGFMLVISAVLQQLSGLAFVVNTWPRVKEKQMPRLSVWFVRCSLIYLLLGLTLGSLLLANKGASWAPWIWNLLPAHMEFLLLGWMAQLAMGVAFWILPRFGSGQPRGNEHVMYSVFLAWNLGVWMVGAQPYVEITWLALSGRALEALSGFLFLFASWQRIKPLEA